MKYVYLLRAGKDHYKVGVAKSVTSRIGTIRTSNPERIEIVAVRLVEYAEATEKAIHAYLYELRTGGGTEWFKLRPGQALDVCVLMNQQPELTGIVDMYLTKRAFDKQIKEFSSISRSLEQIVKHIEKNQRVPTVAETGGGTLSIPKKEVSTDPEVDETFNKEQAETDLINKALEMFIKEGRASTSLLQRKLSIGYGRASRLMDSLEERGYISSYDGAKARRVLGLPLDDDQGELR